MKRLIFGQLVLLLCFGFAMQKKTKIIFFGDSITELGNKPGGYITRVDSLCRQEGKSDQFEFVGAGIGGNKVYDLYLRLEDDVLSKNPDVVVIYIGVNDVWHKTLLGTGTDADKFEKFYQTILNKLKAKNIKALLCTPAVIGEKTDFSNPLDGDLNKYSNIIRGIAIKNNLQVIDLRKQFLEYLQKNNPENKEKDILTYDRVHMNERGNAFIAASMWRVLKEIK